MRFKRIEISGFKSFAHKTVLEFHEGVTVVVGPNGCGKSNISDSIKWVLGEQSAKSLRGNKMDDVIFNGTSEEAAVNFAEVSIVFSNEDKKLPINFDEVMVSRRLYRTGESEYYMNKNIVRLKDVQSLLAGTGLGVGNYSVIEQGKIDQVISAKPENRRSLFEEAAGITRFKTKKKEALRKLELTEQNLQRINDILNELKRQINSLERQAKKAEKYKKDFEKLKHYDLYTTHQEMQAIAEERNTIREQLQSAQSKLLQATQELSRTEVEWAECKKEQDKVEATFAETRSEQMVLENQIRSNGEKQNIFRGYLDEASEKMGALKSNIENCKVKLVELEAEFAELNVRSEHINAERVGGESHYKEACNAHDEIKKSYSASVEILTGVREQSQQHLNDKEATFHRAQELQTRLKELSEKEITLNQKVGQMAQLQSVVQAETNDMRVKIDGLNQDIRSQVHERERLEATDAELNEDELKLRERSLRLDKDLAAKNSRVEVLEDLTARHEGFAQGAKFILEAVRNDGEMGRGVLGALADLVDVERGFELAVEAALQALAEAIVCESNADADRLINHLKHSKSGVAAFLSLESLSSSAVETAPIANPNLIPLENVVRPHARLAKNFKQFVQNIYVVTNDEACSELRRQYPTVRFVTKGGDFYSGGIVVGGATDGSEAGMIFGREARIRELKSSIIELEMEKNQIIEDLQDLKIRKNSVSSSLKECAAGLPQLQVEVQDLKTAVHHKDAKIHDLSEQQERLREELVLIDLDSKEMKDESLILEERKVQIVQKIEELKASASAEEQNMNVLSAKIHDSVIAMTEAKNAWESIEERAASISKESERLHLSRSETVRMQESQSEELQQLDQKISETKVMMEELHGASEAQIAKRETLLERFNQIAEERNVVTEKMNSFEASKKTAETTVNETKDFIHKKELAQQETQHRSERLREKISQAYNVDILEFKGLESSPVESDGDETAVEVAQVLISKEDAEAIRERIAKIGGVNMIAVEEYDEIKERYDFMLNEREDLIRAKDDIHKAIIKINRQTREMFITTFTQIQQHFVEYYKMLFGGGNAELILMDEQDVLESGIEIVARPPGKKLRSITLLSGGEKALTAIALMFAVFKVKPSPFCVLDEIDAPLDDVNVQRFANVLQEFLRESQFIIITHNKRTMSLADAMFGVTMEKSGISRIVSVKFDQEATSKQVDHNRKIFASNRIVKPQETSPA